MRSWEHISVFLLVILPLVKSIQQYSNGKVLTLKKSLVTYCILLIGLKGGGFVPSSVNRLLNANL